MKYWISKYALTRGVFDVDCNPPGKSGYIYPSTSTGYKVGKDAHETREAACQDAEARRQKKIKSIKKKLAELESLRFCVDDETGD